MTRGQVVASTAGWGAIVVAGLLGLGGAASRPEGGWLLGRPSLAASLLWLLAVGVLACCMGPRRRGSAVAACGLLPLLVLVVTGPRIPGLAALTGPPLLALALSGIVTVVVSAGWRPPRWSFLPAVFLVYCVVAARAQMQVGPQGDEPHYLMVAESLLRDGDVSLEADYAEGRYQAFFDGPLLPHYRVRGKNGEIYSLHAVGLSLLILPAYAAGGYPGASFFMALLAALLALQIRGLLSRALQDEAVAEGTAWAVALSPPLIHYAGLVFTEIPAALFLVAAFRHCAEARSLRPSRALGAGLCLAFLPWLNVRYAPLAALVVLYAFWQGLRLRSALALIAPIVASGLGLAWYHFALYGFFDPRGVYGRRPELSLALLPEGLPGLLLDQEFGLLTYAPLFALAVPGLFWLWRRDRRQATVVMLAVLVAGLTAGAWPMWRGGFNPPGRFLVPVVPFLALAVAAALRERVTAAAALLVGFSLWMGAIGAAWPRLVHRDRDGTAPLWRAMSGAEEWTRLLPGYVLEDPDRNRLALVWTVAGAVAILGRRRASAAGLGLASAGLLAAVGTASVLSHGHSGGRDAVRLVGRPAAAVPGLRLESSASGEWAMDALGAAAVYEPHRFPEGWEIGERLPLSAGSYRLVVVFDDLSPAAPPPTLQLRPEGGKPNPGESPLRRADGSLEGEFTLGPEARAVSLRLLGGGPFVVRRILLWAQPLSPGPV